MRGECSTEMSLVHFVFFFQRTMLLVHLKNVMLEDWGCLRVKRSNEDDKAMILRQTSVYYYA